MEHIKFVELIMMLDAICLKVNYIQGNEAMKPF